MKKLICVVLLSIMLVSALGLSAFAATNNGSQTWNFEKSFYGTINSAFIMYYTPREWDEYHCWSSTEISVANDMSAYAYTNILGTNGHGAYTQSTESNGGYVKTDAAFVDSPVASKVQYNGNRSMGDVHLNVWSYNLK